MGSPTEPWARATQHVEVVGESHYGDAFRAILKGMGEPLTPEGRELRDLRGVVVADPRNPFDADAVAVWIRGQHVGYLDRGTAKMYSATLQDLAEQGLHLTAPARIWVASGLSGIYGSASVVLPPPDGVQSFNEFPDAPCQVLPAGGAVQINGEEEHMDVLGPYISDRERHLVVSLHLVPVNARSSQYDAVEVRLMGQRVGQLSKTMSEKVRDVVAYVADRGRVPVCRAVLKGSPLRADVTLYVARSNEVTKRWLDGIHPPP